ELRRDLGDDTVLLGELRLELRDLGRQLLLALARPGRRRRGHQRAAEVLVNLAQPVIEDARLQAELVAQIRDRHLVDQVAAKDGGLLLGGVAATGPLRHRAWAPGRVRTTAAGPSRSDRGRTLGEEEREPLGHGVCYTPCRSEVDRHRVE